MASGIGNFLLQGEWLIARAVPCVSRTCCCGPVALFRAQVFAFRCKWPLAINALVDTAFTQATFGYKMCNIVVFLGLAMAVVAMELGWFTPLGLSYQDFLFTLNPTILTPVRSMDTPVWWWHSPHTDLLVVLHLSGHLGPASYRPV